MQYKAITWVQGNPLTLRIPLEKVIITPAGTQTTDYIVQEGDVVAVRLRSERMQFDYEPEIEGNIAIITDESRLLIGLYAVEVTVTEATGEKRRSFFPNVINIVKTTPEMLASFDDFPIAEGIVLDTPGIFFDFGGGGTVDAYTKAESDARFVQKTEMTNYPTQQQMQSAIVAALLPYATQQWVNGLLQGLATEQYVNQTVGQEANRATEAEQLLGTSINSIEAVIPSAASAQNQLADKDFVNHSVATNTANFIGTFQSVADLEAYSGTLTNNDYAFVIVTDAQGNEYYDRYKYNANATPPAWLFEYRIESTAFTAAQWAAIQSGITAALVTKLQGLENYDDTAIRNAITLIEQNYATNASLNALSQTVDGKQAKVAIEAPTDTTDPTQPITTLACEVGRYYRIDVAVDTLAVTLPAVTGNIAETVVLYLTAGTTPVVTIASASAGVEVLYHSGYEIAAGKTYEINCLWNGAAWVVAAVEIEIPT